MTAFSKEGNTLLWRMNGETLSITPWGENSLRVRSAIMREIDDPRYALLEPTPTTPQIEISDTEAAITNGNLRAVIREVHWGHKAQIAFYNQHGDLLLRETDGGGALNTHARAFKPILGGDFSLTASFESAEKEHLYGMGQYQQPHLDIKGCTFELAQRNSQASVPFILSSLGYGFFWHNPAVGEAHFSKNITEWKAYSTKQLDYWITAGDTPAEIEEAYARATGTVPMMPEYGLGFWQCKLRYWNQEQLLSVAREYKRRGLPIDVIVCDFFHWPHLGDFRFDPEFFPDPKAMVDELKAMDIELMVSVWPQIGLDSENFEEMHQQGLLIRPELGVNVSMQFGGDSVFYDATNPRARDYVWQKCKKNYYDLGIKVFWLDEAEPEYGKFDFENYRYYLGPNVQIGNIYPQHYAKTFYDGMVAEGQQNPVNLLRCAWAGSQRYGALVWSGDIQSDFATLRRQVCAGLGMGIAGIPWWTTDIGGFHGGVTEDADFRELLVRWFQWGAFCPVMRLHGDRRPGGPVTRADGTALIGTGADNEVWSFGEEAYGILTRYMFLREAMRDYTRELMRAAHERGTPVMRTMFYEFPGEEACWVMDDQYMYGPDVLVAPVMEANQRERAVYLPKGTGWTHLDTGKAYEGGQTVTIAAPLDSIPVFLRGDSHPEWRGVLMMERG